MDKDSRESKDRGTLLQVIKREPNAWVSSLKESMESILRPSNHLIAIGPKLDENTLHIQGFVFGMDKHSLIKVANMLHRVRLIVVDGER